MSPIWRPRKSRASIVALRRFADRSYTSLSPLPIAAQSLSCARLEHCAVLHAPSPSYSWRGPPVFVRERTMTSIIFRRPCPPARSPAADAALPVIPLRSRPAPARPPQRLERGAAARVHRRAGHVRQRRRGGARGRDDRAHRLSPVRRARAPTASSPRGTRRSNRHRPAARRQPATARSRAGSSPSIAAASWSASSIAATTGSPSPCSAGGAPQPTICAAARCRGASIGSTCSRSTPPAPSTSARSRRPRPPCAPRSTASSPPSSRAGQLRPPASSAL